MKLKRIKISAFRIYDDPADATFDFTAKDGYVADFVSIYAPNGFGKTSFYDAVEWCMTGNILRFWQDQENTQMSIDSLKEVNTEQILLWRHTDSAFETYVQIEPESGDSITRELTVHGRSRVDAKNNEPENKEFRRVILSQEWISGFLKERDGEQRYEIFMENPELAEADQYFKGLKSLLSVCRDRIGSLHGRITGWKEEMQVIAEGNLLEDINSSIAVLQQFGEKIQPIRIDMERSAIVAFKNLISGRLITMGNNSNETILGVIRTAKAGNEEIVSIDRYYDIPASIIKSEEELKETGVLIAAFQEQAQLKNERISNLSSRGLHEVQLKDIADLLIKFPGYNGARKSIDAKRTAIIQLEESLKQTNRITEEEKRNEINTGSSLQTSLEQINTVQKAIERIPALTDQIVQGDSRVKELSESLLTLTDSYRQAQERHQANESRIQRLEEWASNAFNREFSKIPVVELGGLKEQATLAISNQSKARDIEAMLRSVEEEISRNASLDNALQAFIQTGMRIVSESLATSCPLCTQTYVTYQELSEKISGNTALSDTLQRLTARKAILLAELSELSIQIEDAKKQIEEYFRSVAALTGLSGLAISTEMDLFESQIVMTNRQIQESEQFLSDARNELQGQEPAVRLEQLNARLTTLRGLSETQRLQLEASRKRMEELKNETDRIKAGITLTSQEIVVLETNADFLQIQDYFFREFPGFSISESRLIELKAEREKQQEAARLRFTEIEKELGRLQIQLSPYSKESLDGKQQTLTELVLNLQSLQKQYESYLSGNLSLDARRYQKTDLLRVLEEREASTRALIQKQDKIREEYQKIEKFTGNLEPYLKGEQLKRDIADAEQEADFLESEVFQKIKVEKEKVQAFLTKEIEEFFFTDLINSIYQKIDPHPDFKSVKFQANLELEKPKLDIYITNAESELILIPNLYFSTAQINILSLSIFLASALNSEKYNCIFIDDPIQSLDSINILSTIDLIRSIVMNQKRQIVLSTHDANFHALLQKKIPTDLFRSKYIELASFGKVKTDVPPRPPFDEKQGMEMPVMPVG